MIRSNLTLIFNVSIKLTIRQGATLNQKLSPSPTIYAPIEHQNMMHPLVPTRYMTTHVTTQTMTNGRSSTLGDEIQLVTGTFIDNINNASYVNGHAQGNMTSIGSPLHRCPHEIICMFQKFNGA
jgi:hypothetical protein